MGYHNNGMDAPDLTGYIVDRLSDAVSANDIIKDNCESTGLSWPEVESLIVKVQVKNEQEVTRRQFPLLTIVAFSIFVGGIGF